MEKVIKGVGRRHFIKSTAAITTGLTGLALFPQMSWAKNKAPVESIHIIGPKSGSACVDKRTVPPAETPARK